MNTSATSTGTANTGTGNNTGTRRASSLFAGGGRPSMGIQNIEAMGTVYWTEGIHHDIEQIKQDQQCTESTNNQLRQSHYESTNFVHEIKLFLELGSVTTLMYLGFAISPLVTASFVGRLFGPVYLSGFSLANLMGNLCTQSLVTGMLGAVDTLSPQAFSKGQYEEVGYLMIRGTISSVVLLIPINILLILYLENILLLMGEDAVASRLAQQWYNVFVWSLPFSILYNVLCKFLTVQRIMYPVIVVSVVSCALIVPTLHVCCRTWGFVGTAIAYDINWVMQSVFLLGYVFWKKPHEPKTWPTHDNGGFKATIHKSVSDWNKLKSFVWLGFGGMLSQSEWVFWEALGLVVGKLGIIAMSVHTIPNQIVMNVSTVPISFGIALAVRLGLSFPSSVRRTQQIAVMVTASSMVFFVLISILLYIYKDFFIEIFVSKGAIDDDGSSTPNGDAADSDDPLSAVFDLAEDIWPLVSIYNVSIALFGLLAGIASGLAKQWDLAVINIFWLWIFGMPIIYYTTIIKEGGSLKDAWFWMTVAYTGINCSLLIVFLCSDWYKIQDAILYDPEEDEINDPKNGQHAVTANEYKNVINHPTETTNLL